MELVIADHTRTDLDIEIHAAECHHLDRLVAKGYTLSDIENETRADVFFDFNEDFYQEGGKDACHHLAFKPCTRDLPNGVWPEEFGIDTPKKKSAPAPKVVTHELVGIDTADGIATWTCDCGKTGTSKLQGGAKDGHRSHAKRELAKI